ncbi:hypothetical protein C8R44DRAFT_826598 [Mycena epipterygia]|nr:hypothetical protein C8R44DRAFT_826598 [Mycena epipterygia]
MNRGREWQMLRVFSWWTPYIGELPHMFLFTCMSFRDCICMNRGPEWQMLRVSSWWTPYIGELLHMFLFTCMGFRDCI